MRFCLVQFYVFLLFSINIKQNEDLAINMVDLNE